MQIDTSRRTIGLNFLEDNSATIRLWAPYASKVWLVSDRLTSSLLMAEQESGYWFIRTDEIKAGDHYGFEMWNEKKKEKYTSNPSKIFGADPAALFFENGIGENSTAFNVNSFSWTDQSWKGPAQQDYIIYELHTGTFTPEGTFQSIEAKLDYLLQLGITAIEIMPVAQFPGERNWGYDGVFPFAVQNSYGGPEALQHLVNACHNRGLAVILDVVYNHMGPEGNYFNDFGPYFTNQHHTPWGQAINFDDADSDPVRHYFIENVLMWFRDFHIDALRLDAVHAIKDFGAVHILAEIKKYTDRLSVSTDRVHHLFVELDLNDNRYINHLNKGGYGMDGQWIDEFHHALRVTAGQEKNGYYADFNGIEHLAKSYETAYVYDGQYSPHRRKTFGTAAKGNNGEQFIVFSQNHDQVGNRMLGERTSSLMSFEMLKLLAGAVFCSPYLPLIFMGEEYGEENPFQFFISHTDKQLVEAVRKGRKAEFKAFHHAADTPDPQSEATFNRSKLNWDSLNEPKQKTLLTYYKTLIALRKNNHTLNNLNRHQVKAEAIQEQNCLILNRWHDKQKITSLMNFSAQEQQLSLPNLSNWQVLLHSADVQWGGANKEMPSFSDQGLITIKPESILIFTSDHV
jgi:maltooligosyltrehalose trehalohydrolase